MTPYAHMYMQRRTSTKAFNMINRAKFQLFYNNSIFKGRSLLPYYERIVHASLSAVCVFVCLSPNRFVVYFYAFAISNR